MSHVTTIDIEIKDLDALEACLPEIGLELVRGQETYRWFGQHVGDYPLPEGFSKEDMGKCEHAIRIKDKTGAYEIGVVKARDGKQGYTLIYDFWAGGRGMSDVAGEKCQRVKQSYAAEVTRKTLKKQGFRLKKSWNEGVCVLVGQK